MKIFVLLSNGECWKHILIKEEEPVTSDRSCWLLKRLWLKRPQPNGVKPEPHGPFGTKPTNPSRAARLGFPSHVKTVAPVGRATGEKVVEIAKVP